MVVDVESVEGKINIHKTVGFLYKSAPSIKGYTNIYKLTYTGSEVFLSALIPD